MNMRRLRHSTRGLAGSLVLVIAGLLAGAVYGNEWTDRCDVIKPAATELGWLRIPWVLDLQAARATARAEARPIFLWATGDEPLGRC